MKRAILTCAAVLMSCSMAGAMAGDNAPLFDINIGMKNSAMAGAFTGIADDTSAVYINPAGLTAIHQIEISGAYDKWMMDSSFEFLNVGGPAGPGTICGGIIYSNMGIFPGRDAFGVPTDNDTNAYDIGGALGFGMPVNDLISAGLSLKFTNTAIGNNSNFGMLFDAGVMLRQGIFSLGIDGTNIEITPDAFASCGVKAGLAAAVLQMDDHKVTMDIDMLASRNYPGSFAIGGEYTVFRTISVRAGYLIDQENSLTEGASGFTAGMGINLSGLSFEYAFESHGLLGSMNMAGINLIYENSEDRDTKNYNKLQQFLADQYFREAQDYYEAGDYKNALLKYEQVSSLAPDYEGVNAAIAKAKMMVSGNYDFKKADVFFNEGMDMYGKGDYAGALKNWGEVKKYNPDYRDIDMWLQDAGDMAGAKPASKAGEQHFREGLKYYNDCDYADAVASWSKSIDEGGGKKIQQYIDRAKARMKEMQEGLEKAKLDVSRDSTLTDGIKKLRTLASTCPLYKDANAVLAALKTEIETKSREYYYKGIEAYTGGNLDAAIIYWKSVEDMDPKSEYAEKVRRDIEDARKKLEAVKKMDK